MSGTSYVYVVLLARMLSFLSAATLCICIWRNKH